MVFKMHSTHRLGVECPEAPKKCKAHGFLTLCMLQSGQAPPFTSVDPTGCSLCHQKTSAVTWTPPKDGRRIPRPHWTHLSPSVRADGDNDHQGISGASGPEDSTHPMFAPRSHLPCHFLGSTTVVWAPYLFVGRSGAHLHDVSFSRHRWRRVKIFRRFAAILSATVAQPHWDHGLDALDTIVQNTQGQFQHRYLHRVAFEVSTWSQSLPASERRAGRNKRQICLRCGKRRSAIHCFKMASEKMWPRNQNPFRHLRCLQVLPPS